MRTMWRLSREAHDTARGIRNLLAMHAAKSRPSASPTDRNHNALCIVVRRIHNGLIGPKTPIYRLRPPKC